MAFNVCHVAFFYLKLFTAPLHTFLAPPVLLAHCKSSTCMEEDEEQIHRQTKTKRSEAAHRRLSECKTWYYCSCLLSWFCTNENVGSDVLLRACRF